MTRKYNRTKPYPEKLALPCPACGGPMRAAKFELIELEGEPMMKRYRHCSACPVSCETIEVVVRGSFKRLAQKTSNELAEHAKAAVAGLGVGGDSNG